MSPPYTSPVTGRKPPEVTARSTTNWRQWWRAESERVGTDWQSLHQQHVRAWRALRSLAESSGAVP
jgi:hypothetical protein